MPKVQVTLPKNDRFSGEVVAVDIDDIDLGDSLVKASDLRKNYVPKDVMESEIRDRLSGQAANLRAQLLEDEKFGKQVLAQHGVSLGPEGQVKFSGEIQEEALSQAVQERLEAERQKWESENLAPIKEAASNQEQTIAKLQRQLLHSEILEAGHGAGVRSDLFQALPNAPRESIPVIAQTERMFGVDEHGHWSLRDLEGDGFVPNPTKDPNRPNAGPEHYFKMLRENEAAKGWFDQKRTGGPPMGAPTNASDEGGSNGQDGGTLTDRMKNLRKEQTSQF